MAKLVTNWTVYQCRECKSYGTAPGGVYDKKYTNIIYAPDILCNCRENILKSPICIEVSYNQARLKIEELIKKCQ